MSEYLIPPQSAETEESILARILINPCDEIFDLSVNDFYRTSHQIVYRHAKQLYQQAGNIDIVELTDSIRGTGELERIGGAVYLSRLYDAFVISDVSRAVKSLRAYRALREMIRRSHEIIAACYDGTPKNAEKVIEDAKRNLSLIEIGSREETWVSMDELVEQGVDYCEALQVRGGVTGVPSGLYDLDAMTCGWQPTDLIIVAGRPGMGKTAFALTCLLNAAKEGSPGCMFSLEMASQQLFNRWMAQESRINSFKFRSGRFSQQDWEQITAAAGRMFELPIWIDDTPSYSYRDIRLKTKQAIKTYGVKSVWIDYLGFISSDHAEKRTYEFEIITRNLKAMAKEFNIPLILLCQLNRQCELRENKRPQLADLRDSGAIEQDADVVLFLYRLAVYLEREGKKFDSNGVLTDIFKKFDSLAEVIVAKQRNGPTGPVTVGWDATQTRFYNREKHQ